MEPRLKYCGRPPRRTLTPSATARCNGATAEMPWKTRPSATSGSEGRHAVMEPRLKCRGRPDRLRHQVRPVRRAVMEPRLGCRGKPRRRCTTTGSGTCFNGATAGMPWKTKPGRFKPWDYAQLQWSHGWDAVENQAPPARRHGPRGASMEPRLGCRGKPLRPDEESLPVPRASMEPRLGCRGNGALWCGATTAQAVLQWNHGENRRGLGPTSRPGRAASSGFNRATAQPPWKRATTLTPSATSRSRFNGATARMPWKTPPAPP